MARPAAKIANLNTSILGEVSAMNTRKPKTLSGAVVSNIVTRSCESRTRDVLRTPQTAAITYSKRHEMNFLKCNLRCKGFWRAFSFQQWAQRWVQRIQDGQINQSRRKYGHWRVRHITIKPDSKLPVADWGSSGRFEVARGCLGRFEVACGCWTLFGKILGCLGRFAFGGEASGRRPKCVRRPFTHQWWFW